MFRLDLNGAWALAWCDPGEGEARGWSANGPDDGRRIVARVPGDVHVDLIEAGLIEEPLFGRNAPDCRWVEEKDWWYARTFDLPAAALGRRVELHFAGLDTTADVYLNGTLVGSSNNMHVPHAFDVTGLARAGANLLVVRLDVGLRAVEGKDFERYRMGTAGEDAPRSWMRKAQFTFGWDWAPRLLTCGIWRGVALCSYDEAALRDVCLRASLEPDGSARVEVLAEVENYADSAIDAAVGLTLVHGTAHAVELTMDVGPGRRELAGELTIPEPHLWWPAPLGGQPLYDVTAVLGADGREQDRAAFRWGLREVGLVREPDGDGGETFIIAVNGRKVFCKGANWVPADSLIARVSPARYGALIGAAREANFNMLRVWGGGVFEDDVFYDLCDEMGILVWQDFLYACTYYPDDDAEFMAEAEREAEKAVRRLRSHASLALWCGNNENQWIHQQRAEAGRGAGRCIGERIYDEVLPGVVSRLDPTRPYWPSSPWGGRDLNSPLEGDRHAWDVSILAPTEQERIDYRRYADDTGRFISEFGVIGPPALRTMRRYLPPDELQRGSPSWDFHTNAFEKRTTLLALERYWRPVEELSLEDYVRFSQAIQAEALKFALEHWRRRKFGTAGALFWMYADCWGEVGWTVIDRYLGRKPSYWAVRRAFASVLASFGETGDGVAVWLVNDTLRPAAGRLRCGWVNVRTGEMTERETAAEAPANAAAELLRLSPPEGDRDAWAGWARFELDGQVVSANRHFLAGFRFNRIEFPEARLIAQLAEDGESIQVASDGYAWQVHLDAPTGVSLSDNDFDLLPGESRRIALAGPPPLRRRVRASALNAGRRPPCDRSPSQ